jgi:hypothetical protein
MHIELHFILSPGSFSRGALAGHFNCNATLAVVLLFRKALQRVQLYSLRTVRYGIITSTANTVTTVVGARHFYHFSERIDRQREQVANATLGLDHARCARIDLQFAPRSAMS